MKRDFRVLKVTKILRIKEYIICITLELVWFVMTHNIVYLKYLSYTSLTPALLGHRQIDDHLILFKYKETKFID